MTSSTRGEAEPVAYIGFDVLSDWKRERREWQSVPLRRDPSYGRVALYASQPHAPDALKEAYQNGWNDRESDLLVGIDRTVPHAPDSWRPIETHDGSTDEVLLGWEDGTVIIGEWSKYLSCFDWASSLHPEQDQPSHWQPLPAPPSQPKGEER